VYLRFQVFERDPSSQEPTGLFQAAWRLSDAGAFAPWEEARWRAIAGWFHEHLPRPPSAARSSRPNAPDRAIFWFKASAVEHVSRMHEVVALLGQHGVHAEVLRAKRPGFLVYEDEFQVAAEPFRSEFRRSAAP
jgi:hypothetical protein